MMKPTKDTCKGDTQALVYETLDVTDTYTYFHCFPDCTGAWRSEQQGKNPEKTSI